LTTHTALVNDFLAQKRIAVAGVRGTRDDTANLIYRKFRSEGYEVFAVNPNAETAEGDRCYPSLQAIPGGVDGVVIVTRPELTEQIVRDAAEAGVTRVWMHDNTFMPSCASEAAVQFCQEHGISAIAVGCPMMFGKTADFGHKCMRWVLRASGRMPR
jgi:hypothetical protein